MNEIKQMQGFPKEEGKYFVRRVGEKYWQCLVTVRGVYPFLEIQSPIPMYCIDDVISVVSKNIVFSEEIKLEI